MGELLKWKIENGKGKMKVEYLKMFEKRVWGWDVSCETGCGTEGVSYPCATGLLRVSNLAVF